MATNRYISSLAGGGGSGTSGSPWTLTEAIANASAGDIMNIKADGTYVRTGSTTFGVAGNVNAPIVWRGYTSAIGDGGVPVLFLDKSSESYGFACTGKFNFFESVSFFANTLNGAVLCDSWNGQVFKKCVIYNTNDTVPENNENRRCAFVTTKSVLMTQCYFDQATTDTSRYMVAAVRCQSSADGNAILNGCTIRTNSAGIHCTEGATFQLNNCLLVGTNNNQNATYHELYAGAKGYMHVRKCTIYGFNNGVYIDPNSGDPQEFIEISNNIFYNLTGSAVSNKDVGSYLQNIYISNNAAGSIGGTVYDIGALYNIFDNVTLVADPFVNAGSNDFSLNTDPDGGLMCKGVGCPITLPAFDTTTYIDLGATNAMPLEVPSEDDVRDGVVFGPYTGNVVIPDASTVLESVQYGADGTEYTGILDEPYEYDVRNGVSYAGGYLNGNLVVPDPFDVRKNTNYGSDSTEYTGTLLLPSEGDVRDHSRYGGDSTELDGNLVLPDVEDVLAGVQYGTDGTQFTGILSGGSFTSTDRSTLNDTYTTTGDIITNVDEIFIQTENILANLNEVVRQTKNIRSDVFTS